LLRLFGHNVLSWLDGRRTGIGASGFATKLFALSMSVEAQDRTI
jgi:hypothetical protein